MTPRQFYYTLIIFTITLKIQKMPCLVYNVLGKDSIFLVLLFFVVDFISMIIFYSFAQKIRDKKSEFIGKAPLVVFFAKISLLLVSIFFFMQCTIFYEAIQDLFSHILFDNLSWTLFSLFLIFAIYYLASLNLKIIGRGYEIYFFVIVISLFVLAILGSLQTDYTNIFPLKNIQWKSIIEHSKTFNLWFGDYILVFFMGLNTKGTKLKYTLLFYSLSMLFVLYVYYVFYGIYYDLSPMQPSLVTAISEQSLLGVDLGRPDWYCILLSEMGSVLCGAICLCFASRIVNAVIPQIDYRIILIFFAISLYLLDITYLVDQNVKMVFYLNFVDIFVLILKFVFLTTFFIVYLHIKINNFRNKKIKKRVKYEKI